MPIWLRKFTIQSINEYHKKQSEELDKSQKRQDKSSVTGPAIKRPTYSTKARR